LNKYSFYLIIIFLIPKILALTSCANIIPPGGGPRDSLPPVLVKAVPADSMLHFNANKIVLTFDEYVQIDPALQTTVVVSPNPQQSPYIEGRLQTVTVRLKDSLLPNTTYSINFANAIKDVNEGNPYRNFTYVFSTGNTIANGTLSGKVQLAETGLTDSTLIVILHRDLNDSAIRKERPLYYTRIDSAGRFNFRYLAYGKYAVYVLPNDYGKKYDDSTKMFAFLNEPVTIDSTPAQPVELFAYNEYKPAKTGAAPVAPATSTSNLKKPTDTSHSLVYMTNLQPASGQDLLGDFVMVFQTPVAHFDSTKITLADTNYHAVPGYQVTEDTSHRIFSLRYPWKEEMDFKLILQKDAFSDSSGNTLAKTDTISLKTRAESMYGSLRLRFMNLDLGRNPVLQFIQNNTVVDSVQLTQTEFYRSLYKPGDYDMRILYDTDKNLTWTPGSFEMKKQPEIAIHIPRRLTVKQNWDNEVNVNL
jgi:hypothetical protein